MARSKAKASRQVEADIEYEKQSFNVYSMMLLLALLAIIIGCIFLTLELKAYDWDFGAKNIPKLSAVDHVRAPLNSLAAIGSGDAAAC
jgi:hypothetical protein